MSRCWILCLLVCGSLTTAAFASESIVHLRLTEGYWQVWVYDEVSTEGRALTATPFDKRDPCWGPDGDVTFRSHNNELYRVESATLRESQVYAEATPAVDPTWSPDGMHLAVSRLRTDVRDTSSIWLLSVEGKERNVITRGPGLQIQSTWSPDSHALAYVRTDGPTRSQILRVAADGSEGAVVVKNDAHNQHPAWSPDGKTLVFTSDRTGDFEIWSRDWKTGKERRLTNSPGIDTEPAWSPDGQRLAFTSMRGGKLEIWQMDREGNDPLPLIAGSGAVKEARWR